MNQDTTAHHYQGQQGQQYHEGKRSVPEIAVPWIARLRAAKLAHHIKPADVILEYGVGLGWNLAELRCARRIGYDVGEFLAPFVLRHGIEFITDLKSIAEASVDVVICHHTLEHVLEPANTLERIRCLLKPGGALLLFVPFEKERRFRRFNPAEPNRHLYSWNVQTLGALVTASGLEVISARLGRFGQERFAANLAARLHLGEQSFRLLRATANFLKREFELRLVAVKK
jgi:SAM-dependent methyltransferase